MIVTAAAAAVLGYMWVNDAKAKADRDVTAAIIENPLHPAVDVGDDYEDDEEILSGQDVVTQATWDVEPYRPDWMGNPKTWKWRQNQCPPSTSRKVAEDESMRLTPQFKEMIRAHIEDTEWDDIPLRGERADRWAARDRRRVPIARNPNSVFTSTWIAVDAFETPDMPRLRDPREVRALALGRVGHPLASVSGTVGQYL